MQTQSGGQIDAGKKELFETMPVARALFKMAVPTVISQLINLIYNMVDTIYIGQSGDAYKTAAVTLAFSVFMLTISFGNLFGVGGGSLIARLSGRGETRQAKSVAAFSFYGAVGIAILYSLFVGIFMDPLLNFLGASENTLEFGRQYLTYVVVLGDIPVIASEAGAHLLRNAGYSRQAGLGLSIGGLLNIVLDPLFMFVILPPGREVEGAAIATLLSNIVSFFYITITIYRLSASSPLSLRLSDLKNIRRRDIRELFSVGVPSALLTGLFDAANVVLNYLMAAHGDLQLAAIGIVMKAERLPNAINVGIGQAMLPIVAYNYSSGDHPRMNAVIRTARLWGYSISAVAIALYELLAGPVCSLFLNTNVGTSAADSAAAIVFAVVFLRIRCIQSPLQFTNFNTSFCMQAVGYGSGTLLHSCVRELVFYIPFMVLFNHFFGLYGLVSAVLAGELCGGVFALLLFRRWKKKHLNRNTGR